MAEFVHGLDLAGQYYQQLVRPLLERHFAGLPHAAALIGYGSEVLGFDTPMSMDHAWAPRMQIFLAAEDLGAAGEVDAMLARELPTHFMGFPLSVLFSQDEPGVFFMDEHAQPGRIRHRVMIGTLRQFVWDALAWDMDGALEPADWLTFPAQVLGVLTAGRVFCDDRGELAALRERLAFYPDDLWRYLLACGWDRIEQEQPLMQRAADAGDEPGSLLMSSRLARDVMSLCFLMERQYAPYPKWFGAGFARLQCAAQFTPLLVQAQRADAWRARASALGQATALLAAKQNGLQLTAAPVPEDLRQFHQRPYQVIAAGQISHALVEGIRDAQVRRIAQKGLLGGIDQFSDSTILRSDPRWRPALRRLYE